MNDQVIDQWICLVNDDECWQYDNAGEEKTTQEA